MTNPFEEKRKNDRINRLVKENEELKQLLAAAKLEIQNLEMEKRLFGEVARVNDLLREENNQLKSVSKSQYQTGYNQAVWDITHFLTGKQKEVNND